MSDFNNDLEDNNNGGNNTNIWESVLRDFLPYWPVIFAAAIIGFISGKVYLKYQKPVHQSEAGILLKDESQNTDNLLKIAAGGEAKTSIEDELEVLKGSNVMQRAVKILNAFYVVERMGKFNSYTDNNKTQPFDIEFLYPEEIKPFSSTVNINQNNTQIIIGGRDSFPYDKIVNIGGDHSMSIATIADTLNKYPNAKVIYFDAHADINTYESSNSKHYHGMPLSFVTGIDKNEKFSFIKNKLPFENLLYIGGRCWDIFERNEIHKEKIKFLTPNDINNHFESSMNKIMSFVGSSPVHVSFDVDSVDPKYIPSTGTPVKNGIDMHKAISILDNLNNNSEIVNMDITELNMDLGTKRDGIKSGINTEKLFHKFLD